MAHELPRGRQQILPVTVVTGTDVVWSAAQHSSEELQGWRMPWQVVAEHGMAQIPGLFGQQPGTHVRTPGLWRSTDCAGSPWRRMSVIGNRRALSRSVGP